MASPVAPSPASIPSDLGWGDIERRHIAREPHRQCWSNVGCLGINLAQLAQAAKNNPAEAKGIADEVHRPSGSKSVSIRVTREADKIIVEVQDPGRGMPPEKLAEIQSQGSGVGISGMRERLRHLSGELVVESNGSGTKVYATLPLTTSRSPHKSNTEQVVA